MAFNPLTALDGSFLGIPFHLSRESGEGGRRGPLHEYPDRDIPYFEDLGRKAKSWDLEIYFIGPTADVLGPAFDALLQRGLPGTLILPGLRRERVVARSWRYQKEVDEGNWVAFQVSFVEAGRNALPASVASWPDLLVSAALDARTAFGTAIGNALSLGGFGADALLGIGLQAAGLALALDAVAGIAAGRTPSSALAAASGLTGGFAASWGPSGPSVSAATFDAAALGLAATALVGSWADALLGPAPVDDSARARTVNTLFGFYRQAGDPLWYLPAGLTALQAQNIANQSALVQGARRAALAEAARLAASLAFASYDDAAALRARFADAFDAEISLSTDTDGRAALVALSGATIQALTAAGASKAKLVPYTVQRPRSARALAQLFYPDDDDVSARATELAARNDAIHPAFMPAMGERLSS
jgi:prophage DNA circulation protein